MIVLVIKLQEFSQKISAHLRSNFLRGVIEIIWGNHATLVQDNFFYMYTCTFLQDSSPILVLGPGPLKFDEKFKLGGAFQLQQFWTIESAVYINKKCHVPKHLIDRSIMTLVFGVNSCWTNFLSPLPKLS